MWEIIDKVLNLTVLAGAKPKYFLRRPTMVANILRNFMPPFESQLRPWHLYFICKVTMFKRQKVWQNYWVTMKLHLLKMHLASRFLRNGYVKSVRIRSYSGPYFPAFGLNTDRYSISLLIQSELGEIRTRITPNTDTFHAAYMFRLD